MNSISAPTIANRPESLIRRSRTTLEKCHTDCSVSQDSIESSSPSGSQSSLKYGPTKRFKPDTHSYLNPRVFLSVKPLFLKYRNIEFGNSYVREPQSSQSQFNIKPDDAIDMGLWREHEIWIPRGEFEMKLLKMFRVSMNLPIYSHASAFNVVNPEKFNAKAIDSEQSPKEEEESNEIDEEEEDYEEGSYERIDDDQYIPYQRKNKRNRGNKAMSRKRKDAMNMGDDGLYHCPFCTRCFEMGQQLGGHCSRAHPGQSLIYRAKMEKRKKYYDFLEQCELDNPRKAYRKFIRKE